MNHLHALIIDDDIKNAKVLERLLANENVQSTHVIDPRKVAAVIGTIAKIDMVFLDLEMPNLNGYEVLKDIKDDERLDAIPFIAHTVHTSEINNAYQMGFTGFIGKPLDSDQFPNQLARILNGEAVWE